MGKFQLRSAHRKEVVGKASGLDHLHTIEPSRMSVWRGTDIEMTLSISSVKGSSGTHGRWIGEDGRLCRSYDQALKRQEEELGEEK